MKKYRALAFDLDDTLLDTSRYLVPMAAVRACQSMLAEGLHCDLQDCTDLRAQLANQLSHPDIFNRIVNTFGCDHPEAAVQGAVRAFYNPEIPDELPLMPGALENLEQLQKEYVLYLVTVGSYDAQLKKIRAMKLEKYFRKIFIFDSLKKERKESAFHEIIQSLNIHPSQLLSIGNRLTSEIRDGKIAGAETCYFAYGEHVGEIPEVAEDHPDYVIHSHQELIAACEL